MRYIILCTMFLGGAYTGSSKIARGIDGNNEEKLPIMVSVDGDATQSKQNYTENTEYGRSWKQIISDQNTRYAKAKYTDKISLDPKYSITLDPNGALSVKATLTLPASWFLGSDIKKSVTLSWNGSSEDKHKLLKEIIPALKLVQLLAKNCKDFSTGIEKKNTSAESTSTDDENNKGTNDQASQQNLIKTLSLLIKALSHESATDYYVYMLSGIENNCQKPIMYFNDSLNETRFRYTDNQKDVFERFKLGLEEILRTSGQLSNENIKLYNLFNPQITESTNIIDQIDEMVKDITYLIFSIYICTYFTYYSSNDTESNWSSDGQKQTPPLLHGLYTKIKEIVTKNINTLIFAKALDLLNVQNELRNMRSSAFVKVNGTTKILTFKYINMNDTLFDSKIVTLLGKGNFRQRINKVFEEINNHIQSHNGSLQNPDKTTLKLHEFDITKYSWINETYELY